MTASKRNTPIRIFDSPQTPLPELQLLSNGRYHVVLSNAGGGYSRCNELAVTRWREDASCDPWGTFCYLRDLASGAFWSNTHQPTLVPAEAYTAKFSAGRAVFQRRDHGIETDTVVSVSASDDVEVRRIRLCNHSDTQRSLDLTSYAEIVLAPPAADSAHPAFGKLFVETEILRADQAILCTRRPRAPDDPTPWMFHLLAAHQPITGDVGYETDRARFIGRGRSAADPQALHGSAALSGSAGAVLDPIAAIRCGITLEPSASATIDLITGVARTRAACLAMVARYRKRAAADRVFAAARPQHTRLLRRLHIAAADAPGFCQLAASVILVNPALRADPALIASNRRGQSALWGHALSGDLPIALLGISDPADLDLLARMLQAHAYWRAHGLPVDLVVRCGDEASGPIGHERIASLIAAGSDPALAAKPGGVLLLRSGQLDAGDRILLHTVARIVSGDGKQPFAGPAGSVAAAVAALPPPSVQRSADHPPSIAVATPARALIFDNGLGGFTPDGREYVITLAGAAMTPAPWVNVLANPDFGSIISESGSSYTWSENAHEFRLSPWSNDPVGDANTEAFYLRDEDSGSYWSVTRLPRGGAAPYVTRHGFGYSVFEHCTDGIESELTVFVAIDAPVKFLILKLCNQSGRARALSITGYIEWVLGDERSRTSMHVVTERDEESGALFARNAYNTDFAGRTAFFDVDELADCSYCGDRGAFLGRNGTLHSPAAMAVARLSGTLGAGLDPCAAIRVPLTLAAGHSREIIFRLGAGSSAEAARDRVHATRGTEAAHAALARVQDYWQRTLGSVQVQTPDPALNVLANGWLLYQTLACRLWARSGFYQSGGAFGFRDQLQDVMALVHAQPALVRAHLLRSAARQFPEGDAQHWWHPPSGRGVRTRISDDYLWLPLATCRYVSSSGDYGVLEQNVPYLAGRALAAEQESYYDQPGLADHSGSLYQHCVQAIQHGLRFGEHGLPLMGSGDWNDGMNLVGIHGKGESVWLAFFLYQVLRSFVPLARRHQDGDFAERCEAAAATLRQNIEQHAWDGDWYRRAWFDDGTPLGSADNDECRIDSIAQSWSVLSGAGDRERSRLAMQALDQHLVRRRDGLIQLLEPPFDRSPMNPGYIKGYLPGVRENGGQYTHAAVWATMAFAALGDQRRAWELLALINPVNHALDADAVAIYKVEPYVLAADVYGVHPHTSRGGWTWYTGSAGWLYRLILESLLGLQREADRLRIAPCVPPDWPGYALDYRYGESVYHIHVVQTGDAGGGGAIRTTLDGVDQPDGGIVLIDDHREHRVEIHIRPADSVGDTPTKGSTA